MQYPLFIALCKSFKLPKPEPEYKFLTDRKFKIDFAFVDQRIAVEIEGGVWTGGRHVRGSGFMKDKEKYNLLAKEGWRLFRFTPEEANNGKAVQFLAGVFNKK